MSIKNEYQQNNFLSNTGFDTVSPTEKVDVTGCSQRNGVNGDSRITIVGSDPSYFTPEDNMTNAYVNIEVGNSTVSGAGDIFMGSIAIFAT